MEVDIPSDPKDPLTKSSNNAEQSHEQEQEEEEEFLIMADIGHDIDQQTV
ncbi:unnamed protein product, partial [Rotaria sp. Silwood1]